MKKKYLYVLLVFLPMVMFAQQSEVFKIDSMPKQGILLDKGWKFIAGDDSAYAFQNYDDSKWESINPTLDIYDLPQVRNTPVGWLRIRFRVDSSLLNKPLACQIRQYLASEIYLNNILMKKYGVVNANPKMVHAYQPQYEPFGIEFSGLEQVLAIRVSFQPRLPYIGFVPPFNGFILRINNIEGAAAYGEYEKRFHKFNYIEAALFLLLFLIHLSFFIIYPKQKANLFFAMATLFIGTGNILYVAANTSHDVDYIIKMAIVVWIVFWTLFGLSLFLAVHTLFSTRKGFFFWLVVTLFPLGVPFLFISYKWGFYIGMLTPLLVGVAEAFRISWIAYRKDRRGVGIVLVGLGSFFIFFSLFELIYNNVLPNSPLSEIFTLLDLVYHLSMVSMPIALSIFLSLQYAYTTEDLEKKLVEVQLLSEKTLAQEQERQQILALQKVTLENQVTERTAQLEQSLEDLKSTQAQLIQSEKMASLGELTAGIAHEIQNPLNFVNNFSDVNQELLRELKDEADKGNIDEVKAIASDVIDNEEKINHHGKRADAIVKGMLEHSRQGTGKKELTDINLLAEEYMKLAYQSMRAKNKDFNVTMKTDFDSGAGKIKIIPQDIGRVLLNLYNNAFYAVNEKNKLQGDIYDPIVSVSTKKSDDKILITVNDNGNGIPQQIIEKIFHPFFTTKPTGQGTGLGLSLSYDIIKAAGGEIMVTSCEEKYSEFTVVLPG